IAEKLGAPIVKPLLGKAVVPDDHPYTTGGIGLLGTAPSQEVLEECDTLLIAGSSFPYLEFYPRPGQAKAVQIDLDASRIGLRYPVDVGLTGQCWDVLRALLPMIEQKTDRTFLTKAQDLMRRWNELMEVRGTREDLPLKPQVVARALNEFLDRDAIICSDTGTITTWAARHIVMRDEMQFSASGTLATMANGLPYSIGAAVAFPGRQVVCFTGDGGLTMLMGELATIAKYRLPVKVVVIKNNVLGMIKWEQMAMEGNPQYGVQLQPIDFVSVARACGIAGYSVDDPKLVRAVLRDAFSHDGPALVEAVVDPNEPPLPGKITTEQAWQFAKALAKGQKDRWDIIKTVVENKIREVV
ncbi:MAG TPA: thiamine pyrophosphate-dependent enzyme, partial [Nitrospira sp.]|nr:thiamine pyrophosphate-dependent enzyme [Nitrospira sp.]